jgi:hypothetical protein
LVEQLHAKRNRTVSGDGDFHQASFIEKSMIIESS